MNLKKILLIIGNLLIGLGALAVTLAFIVNSNSNADAFTSIDRVVFNDENNNSREIIVAGTSVTESGILRLGNFALFRLIGADSAITLAKVEFDPDTKTIIRAHGNVKAGDVLAINALFGPELTLTDERVTVVNHGGSFLFERELNLTRVRVLSGSATLTLHNPSNFETFTATLAAGTEVTLTVETLTDIFNPVDLLKRTLIWKQNIGEFESHFEEENALIGRLLDQFSATATKSTQMPGILQSIQRKLIFAPAAKNRFHEQELLNLLDRAASRETAPLSEYLADLTPPVRLALKKSARLAIPYSQLFIPASLSPVVKQKIARLAKFSDALAKLGNTSTSTENSIFAKDLALAISNPEQTATLVSHTNLIFDAIQLENLSRLLAFLKSNNDLAGDEWLDIYHTLNRTRANSVTDSAAAIVDQLELATHFVRSGQNGYGGATLRELADLLNQNKINFSPAAIEQVAIQGTDLKNRIVFLTRVSGNLPIDEERYANWLAAEMSAADELAAETSTVSDEPESAAKLDDGRVARPQSELEKFLESVSET